MTRYFSVGCSVAQNEVFMKSYFPVHVSLVLAKGFGKQGAKADSSIPLVEGRRIIRYHKDAMNRKYDEIDKRILYRLTQNARDISAPEIAEEEEVSPATIRNRIKRLEEDGIIEGYHAEIAYDKIEGRLVNLYKCSSKVQDRSSLARKALQVPGVVHVREVMTGGEDIHVKAVGKDTDDLSRIANQLVELGLVISDEDLVQGEYFHPYHDFGPQQEQAGSLLNFRSILGPAEVATVKVVKGSPVEDKSVEEISDRGYIGTDALLISIERGDQTLVPKGDTLLQVGDIVSIFSATGLGDHTLRVFEDQQAS